MEVAQRALGKQQQVTEEKSTSNDKKHNLPERMESPAKHPKWEEPHKARQSQEQEEDADMSDSFADSFVEDRSPPRPASSRTSSTRTEDGMRVTKLEHEMTTLKGQLAQILATLQNLAPPAPVAMKASMPWPKEYPLAQGECDCLPRGWGMFVARVCGMGIQTHS